MSNKIPRYYYEGHSEDHNANFEIHDRGEGNETVAETKHRWIAEIIVVALNRPEIL